MTDVRRDWAQFALLLIDVQRDFWTEPLAESFPRFPANVARLLEFCRTQGIEIVHLRTSFKRDMSDWMARYKLRGQIPCVEGTSGIETLPCALDKPGESVMLKRTFDGFQNPEVLGHSATKGDTLCADGWIGHLHLRPVYDRCGGPKRSLGGRHRGLLCRRAACPRPDARPV